MGGIKLIYWVYRRLGDTEEALQEQRILLFFMENTICMRERRGTYRILVRKHKGKNHLEDPSVDGRIILKWIFKKWDEGLKWIDLPQDRDKWRALVNAVKNRRVPWSAGNFFAN
jgi:hypothetical protein